MLVFGFDVGTTSIGFAAVELNEVIERGSILRLGVRIFPEARDPDGTPLNQQRRAKRMQRRQLRRRKERRKSLNEVLAEDGLLPTYSSAAWATVMAVDPYSLRKRGLTEKLEAHELGRALYHLAKRRHFKGRDLEEREEDEKKKEDAEMPADEKQARTNREATLQSLKDKGATLGAWLADKPEDERKRGIHATRNVVTEEFEKLWNAQSEYHPMLRDSSFKSLITDTIFAQKPVFWRKSTLGKCRFEPDAELCAKGSWLSQQRRMLEKLNNLAIAGGNGRPLEPEERAAILTTLQTQGSMSWSSVRDALAPIFKARGESAKTFKFNLEVVGGDTKLLGNPLEAKFAKIFDAEWPAHPRRNEIRKEVHTRLWAADYGTIGTQRVVIRPDYERKARRENVRRSFINDFGVTEEQAKALAEIKSPQGWEPYSIVALDKMLPLLEQGVRFGSLLTSPEWEKWRAENFPNRQQPTGEFHDRLPTPQDREESKRIAQLRNPTVVRTLNELRKVTNNLIAVYGKPDLIRIELARDVGKSKREREDIGKAMRKQELRRKDADKDLKSKGIAMPSRDDIEKWLLWKESQERCPYTGDQICFDDLFRDNRYQVEHIWPRSRSLDDSYRNKTLCRTDVNIAKGNRTPFEHFEHRPDEWGAIKDRLDRMTKAKEGMSQGKVKRFVAESIPADFASRQLNDTGHAARQAVAFLQKLWPDVGPEAPVKVQAVSGRLTAQLRKRWELNNILAENGEKTRADHRHHAVDALAVACANPGYVKRLSDYFTDEKRGLRPRLPKPWSNIRQDAEIAVDAIVVSHRVRKKVSGPLHKETTYGDTGADEKTKTGTYRVFVTRKKVEALTKGELEDIRDPHVRHIVKAWVSDHGGDPKKAFSSYPRIGEKGPEIRRVRLTVKQQIRLMAPVSTGYADLGSNHHIAIYRLPDGKAGFEVVSLFEASRRLAKREPIVRRSGENDASFVMSLSAGDALEFPAGEIKGVWIVCGAWASGQIVLERSNDAAHSTTTRPKPSTLLNEGARKISVDPIGRIYPAND